jgi:hypothetical protein
VPVFQAYIPGMKQIISLLLILNAISFAALAQSNVNFPKPAILQNLKTTAPEQGTVQIVQDPHIEDLLSRHLELNRRNEGLTGYRILIFKASFQNSREKAIEERSRFISQFNDIPVYYFYEQPESRLFVGDFRTKSEATRMKLEIEKFFKNAIVIETKINFPKLDKSEDKQ